MLCLRADNTGSVNPTFCSIHDDGVGFEPRRVSGEKDYDGLGLLGMRERLDVVRGAFEIHSAPRGGTELIIGVALAWQSKSCWLTIIELFEMA